VFLGAEPPASTSGAVQQYARHDAGDGYILWVWAPRRCSTNRVPNTRGGDTRTTDPASLPTSNNHAKHQTHDDSPAASGTRNCSPVASGQQCTKDLPPTCTWAQATAPSYSKDMSKAHLPPTPVGHGHGHRMTKTPPPTHTWDTGRRLTGEIHISPRLSQDAILPEFHRLLLLHCHLRELGEREREGR